MAYVRLLHQFRGMIGFSLWLPGKPRVESVMGLYVLTSSEQAAESLRWMGCRTVN